MIVFILLSVIFAACVGIIFYGRRNYGVLEACGIPVVKPSLFLGSVPNYHAKVHHLEDVKRFQKYGPIWGVYEGSDPQVHISDPELIRLILVKDFDYFHDRRDMDFGSEVFNEILDYLPGEKWKTVRAMLSPMFTTSKLKSMSDVITKSAAEFAEDLKSESTNGRIKIDTRNRMTGWLIDMFTQATLGVQFDNRKNPNNDFAVAFRTFMGEGTTNDWLYSLSLTFPALVRFCPTFDNGPSNLIEKTFRHVLTGRRKSGEKNEKDFVHILNDLIDRTSTDEYKRLKITEETIISQAVNMFLGGYETSGSTSTMLFYYLSTHPEVQKTLQQEIDSVYQKHGGKINHETIKDEEMPYLTACINETLRLGPPLYRPERLCMKDWSHENIKIKKGTTVFVCNWATHRNPEYFPDPEEFKPERFLPENKHTMSNPYAFAAFGHGPRACIGVRFAYESLKMLFAHLMRNFSVEARKDTKLQFKTGQQIVIAFKPLYVDLVVRKHD